MNIAKSFLTRALSHPELRALTCGKQTLTYGQLAQRVHGLAGGLLNTLHLAPGYCFLRRQHENYFGFCICRNYGLRAATW